MRLKLPVEGLGTSVRAADHEEHGTPIGRLAFPEVSNPTGHVLDALSKQGKKGRR